MDQPAIPRPRGRPRRFNPEAAVATAQRLFHARGYDAVSVADITAALGINPPSFYAAFKSKAGLYRQVLERYAHTGVVPFRELLRSDRPVADSLAELLEQAARLYAADPETTGCLVLEGTRCIDAEAREAARNFHLAKEEALRGFIAARHPEAAGRLTSFVSTTMAGLSAMARNGYGLERLLASAEVASCAIREVLSTSEEHPS